MFYLLLLGLQEPMLSVSNADQGKSILEIHGMCNN